MSETIIVLPLGQAGSHAELLCMHVCKTRWGPTFLDCAHMHLTHHSCPATRAAHMCIPNCYRCLRACVQLTACMWAMTGLDDAKTQLSEHVARAPYQHNDDDVKQKLCLPVR